MLTLSTITSGVTGRLFKMPFTGVFLEFDFNKDDAGSEPTRYSCSQGRKGSRSPWSSSPLSSHCGSTRANWENKLNKFSHEKLIPVRSWFLLDFFQINDLLEIRWSRVRFWRQFCYQYFLIGIIIGITWIFLRGFWSLVNFPDFLEQTLMDPITFQTLTTSVMSAEMWVTVST